MIRSNQGVELPGSTIARMYMKVLMLSTSDHIL